MKLLVLTLFIHWLNKWGGVLILIQSNITSTIIPNVTAVNEVFENLAVELVYNKDEFSIVRI